ncbi:unnamed protein product [Rotaria sp. Silwood1]|nr:unnamed protein product [Rotaria sp. Silwood1]CAF0945567.1 unnamed protein product [Rotaria sp. Silwood1]CAF4539235.1 unnamed protein product [Rotaria sp. Silwood1]
MAKGKKKSKKKDAALLEQNAQLLRRILKLYDQYSTEQNSVTCTEVTKTIRLLIEEGESLTRVFLRPNPQKAIKHVEVTDEPKPVAEAFPILQTCVRPFVRTLSTCEVNTLKVFAVWNICMDLLDCIDLGLYLKRPTTIVQTLSLKDCLLQPEPLYRLSTSFSICRTLRILNLDYNDEIYLDGNHFGCQGAFDIIKLLLLDCEKFLLDKQDKLRVEIELKEQEALLRERQGLPRELTEKKKKKKKLTLDDMPPFGPFVTKIHLFDNDIDCLQPDGFAIVQQPINAFARLIEISEELEELDLDENVIGHVCGGIILDALKKRKESKYR